VNGERRAQRQVFRALLGVDRSVIERVDVVEDGGDVLVVHARPGRAARGRCGVCRRRCGGYDAGAGRRRWRALDAGTARVFIEADSSRVRCREHGVVVAHVPWARHGAGRTLAFDETVAWLVPSARRRR
jgi:transposase